MRTHPTQFMPAHALACTALGSRALRGTGRDGVAGVALAAGPDHDLLAGGGRWHGGDGMGNFNGGWMGV